MNQALQIGQLIITIILIAFIAYNAFWPKHKLTKIEHVPSDYVNDPRPDLPKEIKANSETVFYRSENGSITIGKPTKITFASAIQQPSGEYKVTFTLNGTQKETLYSDNFSSIKRVFDALGVSTQIINGQLSFQKDSNDE